MYVCMYVRMYVCMYIYIYVCIYREREKRFMTRRFLDPLLAPAPRSAAANPGAGGSSAGTAPEDPSPKGASKWENGD